MPDFAYERIMAGQKMTGMFVVNHSMPIRDVIDEVLLLNECSEQIEWLNLVMYLPL